MDQAALISITAGVGGIVVAVVALLTANRARHWDERLSLDLAQREERLFREVAQMTAQGSRGSDDTVLRELLSRLARDNDRPVIVNLPASQSNTVTEVAGQGRSRVVNQFSDSGPIIREVAHGLNTPLSQIEAAVLSLSSSLREASSHDHRSDMASLNRIGASVDVCKDIIAAYTEVANVRSKSGPWSSTSLNNSLQAAAKVYTESSNVLVEVPNALAGYTTHFLLATLLPVLENALDESQIGFPVGVVSTEAEEYYAIEITNQTSKEDVDDSIYSSGVSTKGSHQGLGLSSVRRLLDTRGGSIQHTCRDGWITFEVRLPKVNR
jgi:light-regulated signal transduction histidine kinase (bacteriophytochrome)